MSDDGALIIDLAGESRVVQHPEVLTFGRAGDLVIDEANPYLHRVVGRFFWHGDCWWLENLGNFIELEVVTDGGAVSKLPAREPDGKPVLVALAGPSFRVAFESAGAAYELVGMIDMASPPAAGLLSGADMVLPGGVQTVSYGAIALTPEEKELLVRLAEPCLRDPTVGPADLPANRELALQLGWPLSKFNRKLDYLCSRLAKVGVRGLHGRRGERADNRRWRLVEHAINARLVTPVDLEA